MQEVEEDPGEDSHEVELKLEAALDVEASQINKAEQAAQVLKPTKAGGRTLSRYPPYHGWRVRRRCEKERQHNTACHTTVIEPDWFCHSTQRQKLLPKGPAAHPHPP